MHRPFSTKYILTYTFLYPLCLKNTYHKGNWCNRWFQFWVANATRFQWDKVRQEKPMHNSVNLLPKSFLSCQVRELAPDSYKWWCIFSFLADALSSVARLGQTLKLDNC